MARAPIQLKFTQTLPVGSKARAKLKQMIDPARSHGGNPSIKKRKTARPFAPGVNQHLVLRSNRAKGAWSLLHRKNKSKITSMIYVYAERFKVHVTQAANAGNHLHLVVHAQEKKHLADFLRVLAGRIAVTVTGARKGGYQNGVFKEGLKIGKFWAYLYWSRLVNWGKDFYHVRRYLQANSLEEVSKEHRAAILHSVLIDEWDDGPRLNTA